MQSPETNNKDLNFTEPNSGELARYSLEASKNVIFIVDSKLRITYCNPAWDAFALANGGEDVVSERVLGTHLTRVIPESLSDFYGEVIERCRSRHLTFDFDYECSSAELYRLLHMNIFPLKASGELAFVNSIRVEHIHGAERRVSHPGDVYLSTHRIITMCCHCRRTQRQDASEVWDWVPEFLQSRKWKISHGICPLCRSYYYSQYLILGATTDAA